MSMNINIFAIRQVQVLSTGKVEEQSINFDAIQTPTKVTWEILAHDDVNAKLNAYKEYVLSQSEDRIENVYAEDDVFEECEPIGTTTWNWGKYHVTCLDDWIQQAMEDGYVIDAEAI